MRVLRVVSLDLESQIQSLSFNTDLSNLARPMGGFGESIPSVPGFSSPPTPVAVRRRLGKVLRRLVVDRVFIEDGDDRDGENKAAVLGALLMKVELSRPLPKLAVLFLLLIALDNADVLLSSCEGLRIVE